MFSEKTVQKILGLTKKTLLSQEPDFFPGEREVKEAIEVLYQLMMIPDDLIDFGNAYAEAFEAHYFEDSELAAKLFSNEGLMKKDFAYYRYARVECGTNSTGGTAP